MLVAYAIAGAIMFFVSLAAFGPVGILAWVLAMLGAYWYGRKQGWF
ncbi:MAG: hypothetical protein H5T70_10080 [Chloroflexi bacterium]|nr:hypothetical protein [Thermoleophilia bacterium]MBC7316754.1 hypothetical protein [Chloroflexota bacterium]